jgi:hypothetical protein
MACTDMPDVPCQHAFQDLTDIPNARILQIPIASSLL